MFNYIIKNKIRKLSQNNQRQRHFYNFYDIKSVLVLFETGDYEDVDNFIVQLERLGKRVSAYAYKVKDDKYDYSEVPYRIIDTKVDINRSGEPRSPLIKELDEIRVDVVIDLTLRENYTLEYILAYLDEPFKIGLKKNNLNIYDFMLSKLPVSEEAAQFPIRSLCKEIIHYLTVIKSKG